MPYSRGTKIEDEISLDIINTAMKISKEDGIANLTVSKILARMNVTNRVFYNRFKDINDVISGVYDIVVQQLRSCFDREYDEGSDLCEYIMDVAIDVFEKTYETKLHFAGYLYNYDLFLDENRKWWLEHITPLVKKGIEKGVFKEVNAVHIAYCVWSYCRGFTASSIGDTLSHEEAVDAFKLGFKCLIDGAKK